MSSRHLAIVFATASLLAACVPTDTTQQDAGWVPFDPDASQDAGDDSGAEDGGDSNDPEAGGGDDDGGVTGDDAGADAGDLGADAGDDPGDDPDTGNPTSCLPNRDGVITRAEVPLQAGLFATYRVATDAPVDTDGEPVALGDGRDWDLSGDLPGDQTVIVEARDPDTFWFSTDYPDASYVTSLSEGSDLLGIFQITDDALLLLGVASPEDGFTSTNLEYDPPVAVLSFPLTAESSWSTDATVTGSFNGSLSWFQAEDYASQVDSMGTMKTPFGTFEGVLRVRTDLARTVGFLTTDIRTYLYVAECFGTVASIVSQDDEPDVEFDTASEVRRLAP